MSSLRFGFAARVYLSFLLVFAATLLSAGLAAWWVAGDQAMSRTERTLDQSLQSSEFDLEQEASDLSTLGKWLVDQNEFISLVRSRDSNGLARLLEPLTQTGIVDVLAVSDTAGQITVRVRENQSITQGDNILGQPGVIEALSGKSSTRLDLDGSGKLLGRFTLPIYDGASQPPIGVLLIGFYLDGPFMQRMSSGIANQAVVVYNGRVAITNMAEGSGGTWVGQMAPEEVARAEREGRPSGIVTFENGSSQSIFKFRPLHFPASVAAGMYGVGISSAMIEGERVEFFRAMGGWILLIVVAAGAIAFVFARALTLPVRQLQSAARGLAGGNLAEPIALPRADELGEVADQLEIIRERWKATLEPPSADGKPILCGEIMLDPRSHQVVVTGKTVMLSATEFKLMQYLMTNRDIVVSVSQIIANVWGYAADEDDAVVRMTISRLRKKIERDSSHPSTLVTVPGVGYMLKSKF